MKKVLIILAVIFGLLIIAVIAAPIFFKDDIKAAIDTEIANNVNANVYYDVDKFSVSLIRSFPNLSVSLGDFGIVGIEDFSEDTLTAVKTFGLTVDLMSAIRGDQIKVKNILLDEPKILVMSLANGKANYDITKPSTDTTAVSTEKEVAPTKKEGTEEASSGVSVAIEKWEIRNGNIAYYDEALNTLFTIEGLNHTGSGDFTEDVFDMSTKTEMQRVSLNYEGVDYLRDKHFEADIIMAMDLANSKYTFKENRFALNNFGFGFDGFVSMPGEDIDMDLTITGQDISVKSILSLIPGLYQEYLDGLKVSGEIHFDGSVKGTYNETTMPKVAFELDVEKGNILYEEYPVPIQELTIHTTLDYPSADLRQTSFSVDKFSMLLDGEKTNATLLVKDFEDIFWDFKMDGKLDVGKLTKIIPVEGMDLEGNVETHLASSGRMSDLDAERYAELKTSGGMDISNFKYTSPDLPQGFGIKSTKATFDPASIKLASFQGNAGKTDLNLSGEIRNYLEFALGDSVKVLKGEFNFTSKNVDLNEWMVAEEVDSSAQESTQVATEAKSDTTTSVEEAIEVPRIPTNIDFVLASSIDKVLYNDLSLDNFKGQVVVKDGALRLDNVGFEVLQGKFTMSGAFETVPEAPLYRFDLGIENLSIPAAFQAFNTVKTVAPFAEKMTGDFSTNFAVGGSLLEDLSPNYDDMHGVGLLNIAQASLQDVQVLSLVSGFSNLNSGSSDPGSLSLKDVLMQMEIKEGRVFVQPFDVRLGGYSTTISGSNGIAGDLDYAMTVKDVPTGGAGQAINSLISSIGGGSNRIPEKVNLNLGVKGTFDDPKVKLLSAAPESGGQGGVTTSLTNQAKQQVTQVVDQKKEEVKQEVEAKVQETRQKVEKDAKKELNKAKNKLKNAFGRKRKRRNN